MEHSFVEAIDARKNIYYVNRGGGHVCKKIVLSAVAALLITAANLNLCCSVLVNGREVPGFYSPTRADILSGIAYEAACELLPDTPELPLVQRRYSLSLHAPENDGAALTDAILRRTDGLSVYYACLLYTSDAAGQVLDYLIAVGITPRRGGEHAVLDKSALHLRVEHIAYPLSRYTIYRIV